MTCKFFTLVLTAFFPPDTEWQQVSPHLQDSSVNTETFFYIYVSRSLYFLTSTIMYSVCILSNECNILLYHSFLYYYYHHYYYSISRTLRSTLAEINNVIVLIVSTLLLFQKFSIPFINPLVTVPRIPITISVIVTFMFHSFFSSLAKLRYFSFFLLSFNFTLRSARTAKSAILLVLFFLLIIIRSGPRAEIRWSVCMSKSQRILCVSFS